jgi:hypothetical protein
MNIVYSPNDGAARSTESARGNYLKIFLVFLRLGLTSFGGPMVAESPPWMLGGRKDKQLVRRNANKELSNG